MSYPQIWITDAAPARALIVKGRSAIDWDCLVAYYEDEANNPLWVIEHSGYVCDRTRDRDTKVYARRIGEMNQPPKSLLRNGRHAAYRS